MHFEKALAEGSNGKAASNFVAPPTLTTAREGLETKGKPKLKEQKEKFTGCWQSPLLPLPALFRRQPSVSPFSMPRREFGSHIPRCIVQYTLCV